MRYLIAALLLAPAAAFAGGAEKYRSLVAVVGALVVMLVKVEL